jgi:hypothetical protein
LRNKEAGAQKLKKRQLCRLFPIPISLSSEKYVLISKHFSDFGIFITEKI